LTVGRRSNNGFGVGRDDKVGCIVSEAGPESTNHLQLGEMRICSWCVGIERYLVIFAQALKRER
jgi:hypothetical protein